MTDDLSRLAENAYYREHHRVDRTAAEDHFYHTIGRLKMYVQRLDIFTGCVVFNPVPVSIENLEVILRAQNEYRKAVS